MTNYRIDSEEEALFRSYPYAIYYVQSPSTISYANSAEIRNNNELEYHSPLRSEPFMSNSTNTNQEVNPLALSRYSSSRGSTNSFLHDKKGSYDVQSHATGITLEEINHHGSNGAGERRNCDYEDEDEDEDEEEEYDVGKDSWWSVLAFGESSSFGWKCLQITWRFMVSVAIALTVFYIASKPPAPKVSIKIARIPQFQLAEGVDTSGVSTKMLTCNCTINLVIDNKSKIFGLHIHPPEMEMYFGNLAFAMSRGSELRAEAHDLTNFKLYVGTRNKAMYGAGRSMQDLLESKKGLPLMIRVNLKSRFLVVWGLIKPKFHHQADCLILLGNHYDKKRRSQEYISKCRITS